MKNLFRKLNRRLFPASKLGKRHPLVAVWNVLVSPIRFVWKMLGYAVAGVAAWWKSRAWRSLLWGLPALSVIGVSVWFAVYTAANSRSELALLYNSAGKSAMNSSDWGRARLCFERSIELGIRDYDSLFELAQAAEKSGDETRKAAVLARLAPDDHATFARAHLWKAANALSESPVTEDQRISAEKHLRFTLQLDPDNLAANALLGELYFQRGLMDSAVRYLAVAARESPHLRLMYAKACILTGEVTIGKSSATTAEKEAADAVRNEPENLQSRLEWAEALLILERFEEATRVLADGLALVPSDLSLKAAMARVYLMQAEKILEGPGDEARKRIVVFQLLAAAMGQNPDDRMVFNRMMEIVSLDDEAADDARKFLTENIVHGRALGISHLLLGTSLEKSGDQLQSGFHLEQALRLLPEAPVVANNLAWHLVHCEKPEPERAMALIAAVIAKFPDEPAYIDTRGHVFLKMGRWKEAVDDFQVSLTRFASEPSVHQGLAEAYQNLGMKDLAQQHAALATQLETPLPPKP